MKGPGLGLKGAASDEKSAGDAAKSLFRNEQKKSAGGG